jgi:hypothetical protein
MILKKADLFINKKRFFEMLLEVFPSFGRLYKEKRKHIGDRVDSHRLSTNVILRTI